VKAILRRAVHTTPIPETEIIRSGGLVIDIQRREVHVSDRPIELRRKEFDLLETLARQPEIVLSRDQLLEQVWGYDFYGQTRTVDVHIASLRRKLGEIAARIETVTGIGYRFTK
jgi:DNA-binding response OmpR family regulator